MRTIEAVLSRSMILLVVAAAAALATGCGAGDGAQGDAEDVAQRADSPSDATVSGLCVFRSNARHTYGLIAPVVDDVTGVTAYPAELDENAGTYWAPGTPRYVVIHTGWPRARTSPPSYQPGAVELTSRQIVDVTTGRPVLVTRDVCEMIVHNFHFTLNDFHYGVTEYQMGWDEMGGSHATSGRLKDVNASGQGTTVDTVFTVSFGCVAGSHPMAGGDHCERNDSSP